MFDFLRTLDERPIRLLPERSIVTAEDLRKEVGDGPITACDFYVEGIEAGQRVPGGFLHEGILNVDHHAPVAEMERWISSTNLALELVRASGPVREPVIHHTDCDSVLSSGIAAGVLPADDRFGAAAIAADHTGEEDEIADLLQAMQGTRDVRASLGALSRLLHGAPQTEKAKEALRDRRKQRDAARSLVLSGRLKTQDGLAWARYDGALDTALLPALLPDAVLFMIARRTRNGRWMNKLRLGLAAPPGASLHRMGIEEFDPLFGGRWNAGSNRRSGGTKMSPSWYVRNLRLRLAQQYQG